MRRPVLQRWLRRELLNLAGLEHFSLRKLAAMAQSTHPRLIEPLFLYSYECGSVNKIMKYIYKESVSRSYNNALAALARCNLTDLALSGKVSEQLPREYAKHLTSFAAEYYKVETDAESKRMRQQRCKALQLEKGISTAEISRELGLDTGNVCAFLQAGDVGRLTLKDSTRMMKYLIAL